MLTLTWSDCLALLALAGAGAGHCAGMCGGFALAATAPALRRQTWWRLSAYQAGKTLSYVFVGLAVLLALEWMRSREWVVTLQRGLGLTLAAMMAYLGWNYLTGRRWVAPWEAPLARLSGCAGGIGFGSATVGRAFLIGWLNGLLPCGLSMAAIVYLLRLRAVPDLMLGLVWFGVATLPVMAGLVWLSGRLPVERRQQWLRWGGAALLVGAAVTALRSWPGAHAYLQSWLGEGWVLPADPWCE